MAEAEAVLAKNKNIQSYITVLGMEGPNKTANKGFGFVPLIPLSKRDSQSNINKQLNIEL